VTRNTAISIPKEAADSGAAIPIAERWVAWFLWIAVLGALFYHLGGPALFEPDEGRNAEKAREILLLDDWVTPHENFHPVLDKPMFFYWLIALSYRMFGVSEWAARLPSVIAALGCLIVVFRFVKERWGHWQALWSLLILLTGAEFFALARTVILDMTLTFFLTLALCSCYDAIHVDSIRRRRICCLALYVSLGAATLIKGLVGLAVPGPVIFGYLLATRGWAALGRLYLLPGALLFLAIVLPWYLQADARNAGYLQYFIWDEHFGRFATSNFDRSEPWYYFVGVFLVGFFPWSMTLPLVIREYGKTALDDKTVYLLLWVALPFLFFSASESKLPHYILPIFPALSMLAGAGLVRLQKSAESKLRRALSPAALVVALAVLYLLAGSIKPAILPAQIRDALSVMPHSVWLFGAILVVFCVWLALRNSRQPGVPRAFFAHAMVVFLYLGFAVEIMVLISSSRSAKPVAETLAPYLDGSTQLVFYDTHLAGLPFYLRAERPVWLVTHGNKKRTFLGNYYAAAERKHLTTRWGDALFDFEEFRERWHSSERPLLVVVKSKNLRRFAKNVGEMPERVGAVDEYLLVTRHEDSSRKAGGRHANGRSARS